jgi:hypothetical protein
MIGSAFAKAKRAFDFESSFQEPGKAINEKVRLYAQVGQALIEAKVAGGDPFEAIERLMTWEQFTQSASEAATLARRQDPGKTCCRNKRQQEEPPVGLEAGSQLKIARQMAWSLEGPFCGTLRTFVGI